MASALLRMHKVLVGAALALAVLCILWGSVHALVRREPGTWPVLAVGVVAAVAGSLYWRKLRRNPPLR